MSTHSTISIKNENGTVSSIYCHSDGYLENNGAMLLFFYRTASKIKKMIDLGNMSALGANISPINGEVGLRSLEDPCANVNIYYHRDRSEDIAPRFNTFDDLDQYENFLPEIGEEYNYLFVDGSWYCDGVLLTPENTELEEIYLKADGTLADIQETKDGVKMATAQEETSEYIDTKNVFSSTLDGEDSLETARNTVIALGGDDFLNGAKVTKASLRDGVMYFRLDGDNEKKVQYISIKPLATRFVLEMFRISDYGETDVIKYLAIAGLRRVFAEIQHVLGVEWGASNEAEAQHEKDEAEKLQRAQNKEIAETILSQFVMLTGSKNFVSIKNGLAMTLKPNKLKARFLEITLLPSDTYKMRFFSIGRTSNDLEKSTIEDVYCDQLQDIFEDQTGLYVTLHARK